VIKVEGLSITTARTSKLQSAALDAGERFYLFLFVQNNFFYCSLKQVK